MAYCVWRNGVLRMVLVVWITAGSIRVAQLYKFCIERGPSINLFCISTQPVDYRWYLFTSYLKCAFALSAVVLRNH